jgi:hypothetical protein
MFFMTGFLGNRDVVTNDAGDFPKCWRQNDEDP